MTEAPTLTVITTERRRRDYALPSTPCRRLEDVAAKACESVDSVKAACKELDELLARAGAS